MAQNQEVRRHSYLTALTLEIEKKLQRALASPSHSLQELFADVALEVDDRAQDIILSRDEDAISPATQPCYYDVLSDHFAQVPEDGKRIVDLIVKLWSQSFAANIFALLFHKWLFEVQIEDPEVLLRYSSALVQGATNVFWIDIQTNARRFKSLFSLQKLKVEPVLLHYLSKLNVLQGLELRMTTSTRLKACLYSFTSPGGPMYPTRAVRHAAWDTLDSLFPVGQYPRHVISTFFRLLYPWYWPSSCWNFVVSCVKAIFYSLLAVILSCWEKLTRRPKAS